MDCYAEALQEAREVFESIGSLSAELLDATRWCVEALNGGNKLMVCGNGGSAAEAQHLAGKLVGRYRRDRRPLAAIALNADTAVLTCIGNDYRYEDVFVRHVRALGSPGDVLVVFTTSGNSPNVIAALAAARELGLRSIAFLGNDGGRAGNVSDCSLTVQHAKTARVQEAHQFLLHCLMDGIEAGLSLAQPQAQQTVEDVRRL